MISELNPYYTVKHLDQATSLHYMSFAGKCLSVVDMFTGILNILTGIYPLMLLTILSYAGYNGSVNFKPNLIITYSIYQGLSSICRGMFIGVFFSEMDWITNIIHFILAVSSFIMFVFFYNFYYMIPLPEEVQRLNVNGVVNEV